MKKLALIGKNIQHSKSPDLYRSMLGNDIQYDLLDFSKEEDIPTAKELLTIYDGISITSPYKKHFIPEIQLTNQAEAIGAINCLRKEAGIIYGENTDFYAIKDIVDSFKKKYTNLNIIILGDGVMSNVTQNVLSNSGIDFKVFSRKHSEHFDQLNISEIFAKELQNKYQQLVINTCSRDFVFQGQIDMDTIFWDYNYNFGQFSPTVSTQVKQFMDGLNMLELQARYALLFWSITTN